MLSCFRYLECLRGEVNTVTTRLEIIVPDALREDPEESWFSCVNTFFAELRKRYVHDDFVVSLIFTDVEWINIPKGVGTSNNCSFPINKRIELVNPKMDVQQKFGST